MWAAIVLTVVLLTAIQFLRSKQSSSKKLPPGSWHVPILGHLPRLGANPHKSLLKFGDLYGPIFTIKFGSFTTVVINDGNLIKKAMSMQGLSGRPKMKYFDIWTRNRAGFLFQSGLEAIHTRAFVQKNLKDLGFGGKSMELKIVEQLPALLRVFQKHVENGTPLILNHTFAVHIVSYLGSILFSQDIQPDNQRFDEFGKSVFEVSRISPVRGLGIFIPTLERLFPSLFKFKDMESQLNKMQTFIADEVKEQNKTRVKGQPRDLTDALLDRRDDNPEAYKNEWQVPMTIFEMLTAGMETSGTTLEWIIHFLIKFPKIQDTLQAEIDTVIGSDRLPAFSDRSNMPFTEALIEETLRIVTPLPLSLFRSALEDTVLEGYMIPKDTMVISNVYAANQDPKVWKEPEKFNPERFLDENGNFKKNEPNFAFGTGKRACIGENLARNQVFLFIVSIFQKYTLKPTGELLNSNGIFGIVICCPQFSAVVQPRAEQVN